MPEKKVILCEGVHDLYFFSILLDERKIKHDSVRNKELEEIRNGETRAIKNFVNPRKGKELRYLIKDEGGNKHCIDNFKILYEDKNSPFLMLLCLDGDSNNLKKLRRETCERFRKDILSQQSEYFHLTKSETKHAVFFIPDSLESQVRAITGKNIDKTDHDYVKEALQEFAVECRERNIEWFTELEEVLFGNNYWSQ